MSASGGAGGESGDPVAAARLAPVMHSILQAVPNAVAVLDAAGRFLYHNEPFRRLFALPEELLRDGLTGPAFNAFRRARGDYDHLAPQDLQAQLADWERLQRPGPPFGYDRVLADGRILRVENRPVPEGGWVRSWVDVTARRRVASELREKTAFLEAVLAAMEQGVLVTDRDGRINLWNDRACEILAIPPQILAGHPTTDELWRSQQDAGDLDTGDPRVAGYIARWKAWLESGETGEIFAHERQLPDGRWMLVNGRKLPDGGSVRTLTDITARKRAEAETLLAKEEAERAEARLRAAMDAMPAGVVILDGDRNFQIWNETYKAMSELSDEELLAARSLEGIAALKRREIEARGIAFDTYLEERHRLYDRCDSTARLEHWTGSGRHVELRVNPIPTGGWVSVYHDMTARIEAEQAIAETSRQLAAARDGAEAMRARIAAMLQSIPVGVLVYDAEPRVAYWNDAYCAITGFPPEVLARRPHFAEFSEYIFRTHRRGGDMSLERFMAYRNRVYGGDEKYVAEFFFDRTGLDVQYIVSSLPDGGRVNVIVDITPQKQAERAALEGRDAAEEATRAKSAFLAAMSHEIRTPMNGVLGMAEILDRTALDEDQRAITATIQESGRMLLRLIDDILDFSKIEAGRMELESVPVVLRDIAEAVLDTLASAADAKDLDLGLQIDGPVPAVILGDPVRLRQILLNLAGNAVKFTAQGSVALRISAAFDPSFPSGVRLRFEVADTGPGIEPERHDQLFQPFRQAELSTTRRYGGTGLGLSISARLVALMQGCIGVDSSPGAGARFWFEIPAEPSAMAVPAALDGVDLSGLTVLADLRPGPLADSVAEILTARGMKLRRAGPGAAEEPFDVVLADGRLGQAALAAHRPPFALPRERPDPRALWVRNGREPAMAPLPVPRPVRQASLLRAVAAAVGRASPETESIADPAAARRPLPVPSAAEALAAGRLILVAEDNATNRMVVQRQLGILGYAVETAGDGVEALEMWRARRYGLVLTDCHMPNLDGYELTGAIRAEEAGRPVRTPIVALTANAMAGEAERCRAAGMDGYLAKPVALAAMGRMLARWLPVDGPAPAEAAPQAEPGDAGGAIDLALMARILGSADPEFLTALLSTFRDSYRELEARMNAAMAARDAAALYAAAHAAKGAAANACAAQLRDALEALEAAAAAVDWTAAATCWREVGLRSAAVFAHPAAKALSS